MQVILDSDKPAFVQLVAQNGVGQLANVLLEHARQAVHVEVVDHVDVLEVAGIDRVQQTVHLDATARHAENALLDEGALAPHAVDQLADHRRHVHQLRATSAVILNC